MSHLPFEIKSTFQEVCINYIVRSQDTCRLISCRKHDSEPLNSIKGGTHVNQWKDCQFINMDSAACSWFDACFFWLCVLARYLKKESSGLVLSPL